MCLAAHTIPSNRQTIQRYNVTVPVVLAADSFAHCVVVATNVFPGTSQLESRKMLAAGGRSFFTWQRSIRWKLAAAFSATACFVAAFLAVAIWAHFQTVEHAAQIEALHVAELLGDAAMESDGSRHNLQEYVVGLNSLRKRDIVIVDKNQKGIADANPAEVGLRFDHDPGDEVGQTIADGQPRTFIETSPFRPKGAWQIVVPLRSNKTAFKNAITGAIILEYTSIRDELLAAQRSELYVIIAAGVLVVLLVTFFGFDIARRLTQPLLDLKSSVERVAVQDYAARFAVTSRDEIGLLGVAFNNMAEDLSASHMALVKHKRELEERVAERTQELNQSNTLLQKQVDQRSWEASHDMLTGLINRREFERLVEVSVTSARTAGKHHVVCFMDLDQFKVVNDTCGHAAGDDLLVELAELLQSRIRASDTLARLGGDEFGLLLEGCALARAELIAADLLAAVGDFRFKRDTKLFTIGVSIGIAAVTGESASADILSMADTACYWAKEQGRNRASVYRTGDNDMAARRREMGWIARINLALAEDRFTLYHQRYLPLNPVAETTRHLEVLIRMIDEEGNLVQPGSFIPAAERYNLMPAIDRWVIRTVFSRYRDLAAERGGGPLTCAINLSGTSLNAEGFLEFVRQQAHEHALPPRSICFEITESAAINNIRKAAEFIRECKSMGFLFALDDFGTGNSSFGYLKNLPVDYLKIDGGFVKNLESDAVDKAMTETINRIGHIMGIKTVAEYAENEAIIKELSTMGVDYAQGYGVCKPTPLFTPAQHDLHPRGLPAAA
jgi:diguanylate cyclase (GGDEF)-like protein